MVKILAINAGSSSLKWKLFQMPQQQVLAQGLIEKIGLSDSQVSFILGKKHYQFNWIIENHRMAVEILLKLLREYKIVVNLDEIKAIGHRFVNGGNLFSKSVVVSEQVLQQLETVKELAPLHNPSNIMAIKAFARVLPTAISVVVFDTGFHQSLPIKNFLYSLPYEYYQKFHVRKYGAHGISYRYVFSKLLEYSDLKAEETNAIIMHLGSGASICAIKQGKSFDTSMGFSPVSGITMQTRAGDVDASLLVYLQEKLGIDPQQMLKVLNQQSGILGISGISSDMRDVLANVTDSRRAQLAIEIFVNQIVKYLGAYVAELQRVDALVFTGGIGENIPLIRQLICQQLGYIGIKIDSAKNQQAIKNRLISLPRSTAGIWVIPTNEELMIAQDAYRLADLKA
jgi:acetate kinase